MIINRSVGLVGQNVVLIIWHEHHVIYISCYICYTPVHLKKMEYREKL